MVKTLKEMKKKNTPREQVDTHTHMPDSDWFGVFLVGSIVVQFSTLQKYVRFAFVSHIRLKYAICIFCKRLVAHTNTLTHESQL